MAWYLGAYAGRGGLNSGIYNCRVIPGSNAMSLHGEGRAVDLGVRPYSAPWGWTLARALHKHSKELGIQCIIWDRRIWSGSYCDQGWRDYHGSNPHLDHLHVELSWNAARTLTVALIEATIGSGSQPQAGAPRTSAPSDWGKEIVNNMKLLNLSNVTSTSSTWVRGEQVKTLQGLLMARGFGKDGLVTRAGAPDGIAGPATRRKLGDAQRRYKSGQPNQPGQPDYVAGRATWAALTQISL